MKAAVSMIALAAGPASSFSPGAMSTRRRQPTSPVGLHYANPEAGGGYNYVAPEVRRALDCANNYGLCAIDELLDLSEELDAFLECSIDQPPEVCEDEYMNRQDLSEALLQQGEALEYEMYVMRQRGAMMPPGGSAPPAYGDAMEGGAAPYGGAGAPSGGGSDGGAGGSSYVVEDNAVNKSDATPRASVYRGDDKPFNWDALAP